MGMRLWLALKTQKRIDNYERYISKCLMYITKEKVILNEQIKKLTPEEQLSFGFQAGFLEEKEYKKLTKTSKKKKRGQ